MHIPDGVLSPVTSVAAAVVMLPVWTVAARRVRTRLGTRQMPLLALGAAFCFTVMMFNIPALGGTTAHPVAGTLLAIILDPWAAVLGVSTALAIQALFFGDGGLLAYGANCLTMAFVLPFVGSAVYRLIAGSCASSSPRRAFAAGAGAFIGLNAAAAVVALLLGIQPLLYHDAASHALFFPFGLQITLPAMLGTHLLIAGPAEAIVTFLVVRYLQSAGYALYDSSTPTALQLERQSERLRILNRGRLWMAMVIVVLLTPLGLLAKGKAWGEWDASGLKAQTARLLHQDYLPAGYTAAQEHTHRGLPGLEDYAGSRGSVGYAGAAALGVGTISVLLLAGGRLLAKREDDDSSNSEDGDRDREDREDRDRENRDRENRDRRDRNSSGGSKVQSDSAHDPTARAPDNATLESGDPTPATQQSLPVWMRNSSDYVVPACAPAARPHNLFVERTLSDLTTALATALVSDRHTKRLGLLQRLDPRAKVVAFAAWMLATAAAHRPSILLALYAVTITLALTSRLPVAAMTRRIWLSAPLFVGAIALPAALSTVTPGHELLVLWHQPHLALTAPGLTAAFVLTLRTAVAISFGALLTMTTRRDDLLNALRALGVPALCIALLAMTIRYLTLLLQSAAEMFTARRSRTVGAPANGNSSGRSFIGQSIGALFGRTLTFSEEVHSAMMSRGYTGEPLPLAASRWRASDALWTAGMCGGALLAFVGGRL